MISSVAFKNYKALRDTRVSLGAFNLLIGSNGSGKTSLIEAILRLRTLAKVPPAVEQDVLGGAEVVFNFTSPHDGLEALMHGRVGGEVLQVTPLQRGEGADDWEGLRRELVRMRSFLFDYEAMSRPTPMSDVGSLSAKGGNLAAILAARKREHPEAYEELIREFARIMPEYGGGRVERLPNGQGELRLSFKGDDEWVAAENLSQGTLYLLALLAVVFDPNPPSLVCIDEVDRGLHPRLLREVRDLLYRLSYPESAGRSGAATQVIVTTHSPYMLDLFREHPEEVLISGKSGRAASFTRLSEIPNARELLSEGSLGDMWFSGILGGVPEER